MTTLQVIRRSATWRLVSEELAQMVVPSRIGLASGPSEPFWFVKFAGDWWKAESGYLWTATQLFNNFGPRVVIVPGQDESVQVIDVIEEVPNAVP